ncbi:DUF817 domain-containing protein [Lysobacter soli]|uniref:DUF817 domain-containing protein n=1 Tax=Lysobacter soli TaxID=453783 RepID=A0A3D8VIV0_9GAMM|nr:DUF817 domain-containing protein [Lysobacter soli]RDY69302.1 DUF817 domain-containing protein [Lysobacter soli]
MDVVLRQWGGFFLDKRPASLARRALVELLVFGVRQAWASLFGALLLAAVLATRVYWPDTMPLARYDALFLMAVAMQITLVATGLERPREAIVILVFHVVGTAMEVFKTHMGSWTYPEESVLRIGAVPLFSGFMYAAVGSYMARVVRIFDIRLDRYPQRSITIALAAAIYVNFFAHHFMPDLRIGLFIATALTFGRVRMQFRLLEGTLAMPQLLAFVLVATFIWIAENVATWSSIWLYPNQMHTWIPVSPAKLGSWFLLMIISVVLVTLVHPPRRSDSP